VGVGHFFLRVEESSALAHYLQQTPPFDTLCTVTHAERPTLRGWKEQSVRQMEHIRSSIVQARALEFSHLLHLDDDELLYLPTGPRAFQAAARQCSQHLGDGLVDLHALTLEALSPPLSPIESSNPFAECCTFRHCACDYDSYGSGRYSHGKSIGLLAAAGLAPFSPHHFRDGESIEYDEQRCTHVLPPSTAAVLHYESCSFTRWREKFSDVARRMRDEGRSSTAVQAATFSAFYKRSTESCARLLQAEETLDARALQAAEEAAKAAWSSAKCEPREATACRPVRHARTFGRLTLIPPVAASVAADGTTLAVEQELQQLDSVGGARAVPCS